MSGTLPGAGGSLPGFAWRIDAGEPSQEVTISGAIDKWGTGTWTATSRGQTLTFRADGADLVADPGAWTGTQTTKIKGQDYRIRRNGVAVMGGYFVQIKPSATADAQMVEVIAGDGDTIVIEAGGGGGVSLPIAQSDVTGLPAALAGKQPLDGDLTAIAALTTTSFGRSVLTQANAAALVALIGAATPADLAALVDSAPGTLDTLNELAAALGDDPNFATTVTTALAGKANSADLATVATSGSYNDLTAKPAISVVFLASDFDASGGDFTHVPTVQFGEVPRAGLVGRTVALLSGADVGKVWTITASGPLIEGASFGPGTRVSTLIAGLEAVASSNNGSTVAGLNLLAPYSDLEGIAAGLAADLTLARRVDLLRGQSTFLEPSRWLECGPAADSNFWVNPNTIPTAATSLEFITLSRSVASTDTSGGQIDFHELLSEALDGMGSLDRYEDANSVQQNGTVQDFLEVCREGGSDESRYNGNGEGGPLPFGAWVRKHKYVDIVNNEVTYRWQSGAGWDFEDVDGTTWITFGPVPLDDQGAPFVMADSAPGAVSWMGRNGGRFQVAYAEVKVDGVTVLMPDIAGAAVGDDSIADAALGAAWEAQGTNRVGGPPLENNIVIAADGLPYEPTLEAGGTGLDYQPVMP